MDADSAMLGENSSTSEPSHDEEMIGDVEDTPPLPERLDHGIFILRRRFFFLFFEGET